MENMSTIEHLSRTDESTNEKAREDTQQNPATKERWNQKQISNGRPDPRRKPTEEVQRIKYPNLHRICRLRGNLQLSVNSSNTQLTS